MIRTQLKTYKDLKMRCSMCRI